MLITIRKMQEKDTVYVSEIEQENFSQPWTQAAFLKAMEDNNYIYLVALDGEKVVGYAGCVIACDECDITNIAVRIDYRRMGIANELLKQIIQLVSRDNVQRVFLEVRKSNIAAQNLYVGVGFEAVGVRKQFYSIPTEDAIIMKYELQNGEI